MHYQLRLLWNEKHLCSALSSQCDSMFALQLILMPHCLSSSFKLYNLALQTTDWKERARGLHKELYRKVCWPENTCACWKNWRQRGAAAQTSTHVTGQHRQHPRNSFTVSKGSCYCPTVLPQPPPQEPELQPLPHPALLLAAPQSPLPLLSSDALDASHVLQRAAQRACSVMAYQV